MAVTEPLRPRTDPSPTPLRSGRVLTLASVGTEDLVEVRSPSGTLEVRIRLTEDGPVIEMESVRLVLQADESVDVETKDFNVRATGEVRVVGEMIHLN